MALRDAFLAVSSPPSALPGVEGDQVLGLIYALANSYTALVNTQKIRAGELVLIEQAVPDFNGVPPNETS